MLGIREGEHAVAITGIANRLRRNRDSVPGFRIFCGDVAHRGPEARHLVAVSADREAFMGAECIFDHAVLLNRHDQALLDLERVQDVSLGPEHQVRLDLFLS